MEYTQPEDIHKAAELAKWLIENKGIKSKSAYIISQRKFHIPTYDVVRSEYQKIKREQLHLL